MFPQGRTIPDDGEFTFTFNTDEVDTNNSESYDSDDVRHNKLEFINSSIEIKNNH